MIVDLFKSLKELKDKKIKGDIVFSQSKNNMTSWVASSIVENSLNQLVTLYATLKPNIPSYSFCFSIKNIGPICRLDVNGTIHQDKGRTHKHEVKSEFDPRQNLPWAYAKEELSHKPLKEVWSWLCTEAQISHEGTIVMPQNIWENYL